MAWNVRRSKRIAPGIRLNLTKRGLGISVGPKHMKVSISPGRRMTTNLGMPGSGIRYTKVLSLENASSKLPGLQNESTQSPDDEGEFLTMPNWTELQNKRNKYQVIATSSLSLYLILFAIGMFKIFDARFSDGFSFIGISLIPGLVGFRFRSIMPSLEGIRNSRRAEENDLGNSRFSRCPKDQEVWEQTVQELKDLSQFLHKVKGQESDSSIAPNFPITAHEVVFMKADAELTNTDASKVSDIGPVYLTNLRVVFVGTKQTIEWFLSKMISPAPFENLQVMAFKSTDRKRVLGVRLKSEDWLKFEFYVLTIFGARDNFDRFFESINQQIRDYEIGKPAFKTSQ